MSQKVSRNDPCPCGSGKKYKTCCLLKDQQSGGTSGKSKSLIGRCKVTGIKKPDQQQQQQASTGPNLMERAFGTAIHGDKPFESL